MGTKWDKEAGKVDTNPGPEVSAAAETAPAAEVPAAETGIAAAIHKIEGEIVDLAHKVGV